MAVLVLGCAGLGGCGTADEVENEQIESADQAFSSLSCSKVAANRTFTGKVSPAAFSPRTYNNCTKTYVFDVLNYDQAFTTTGEGVEPATLTVQDADDTPATKAACEGIVTSVIVYKKVNGLWVDQTGPIAQRGVWEGSDIPGTLNLGCLMPSVDYTGMVPGGSYRVAATSRADADALTRIISLESFQEQALPK